MKVDIASLMDRLLEVEQFFVFQIYIEAELLGASDRILVMPLASLTHEFPAALATLSEAGSMEDVLETLKSSARRSRSSNAWSGAATAKAAISAKRFGYLLTASARKSLDSRAIAI